MQCQDNENDCSRLFWRGNSVCWLDLSLKHRLDCLSNKRQICVLPGVWGQEIYQACIVVQNLHWLVPWDDAQCRSLHFPRTKYELLSDLFFGYSRSQTRSQVWIREWTHCHDRQLGVNARTCRKSSASFWTSHAILKVTSPFLLFLTQKSSELCAYSSDENSSCKFEWWILAYDAGMSQGKFCVQNGTQIGPT